jgi:hypothetical protein
MVFMLNVKIWQHSAEDWKKSYSHKIQSVCGLRCRGQYYSLAIHSAHRHSLVEIHHWEMCLGQWEQCSDKKCSMILLRRDSTEGLQLINTLEVQDSSIEVSF